MRDLEDRNLCFWENRLDSKWKKKRDRFSEKYDIGFKGELRNKRNPLGIHEYFLNNDTCEQTNLYSKQKINSINTM
jgi:hypothetical protein